MTTNYFVDKYVDINNPLIVVDNTDCTKDIVIMLYNYYYKKPQPRLLFEDVEEYMQVMIERIYNNLDKYNATKGRLSTWLYSELKGYFYGANSYFNRNENKIKFNSVSVESAYLKLSNEDVEKNVCLSKIIDNITTDMHKFTYLHYIEGVKLKDIAAMNQITRQYVNRIVNSDIEKIRNKFINQYTILR